MARRIRVEVLCDICQADDIETEAEEIEPTLIGRMRKPHVMGLCKEHMSIFEAFRDALRDHGVPFENLPPVSSKPTASASSDASEKSADCLVCGVSFKTKSSLRTHLTRVHDGMTIGQMEQSVQGTDLEDAPKITKAECDVEGCDAVFTWPEFKRPRQRLGQHKRYEHGIESPKAVS